LTLIPAHSIIAIRLTKIDPRIALIAEYSCYTMPEEYMHVH